ncbi:MAG: YbhB/YbcL family Raf kinase inhibitor-like protein [Alphaproteobacteria bacterium]|nr:YbhB/YbcL family Raf kinase inhibitor-like protein [Alphaproteobacteria bacterium]
MALRLTSSAFDTGSQIPGRFTCDGDDYSPPLAWSGAPPAARSFAVVCRDPDAPGGVWYHWAAFGIPRKSNSLAEHCLAGSTALRQAVNDFGKKGYGGPCPPRGHGPHHYHFTLYALDVDHIDASSSAHCRDIEKTAKAHAIETAELIGTYER